MTIHHIEYMAHSTAPGIAVVCTCGHGIEFAERDKTTTASIQSWIDDHLRFFK